MNIENIKAAAILAARIWFGMRQCFQSEAAASQAVISTAAVLVKDRTGGIVENSLMIVGA
jgi:hypothetical protein